MHKQRVINPHYFHVSYQFIDPAKLVGLSPLFTRIFSIRGKLKFCEHFFIGTVQSVSDNIADGCFDEGTKNWLSVKKLNDTQINDSDGKRRNGIIKTPEVE